MPEQRTRQRSEQHQSRVPRSLGHVITAAREAAGISRIELARRSSVSPRTIAKVETSGIARFDAVVRLAKALKQNAVDWVKLAGHDISNARIEEILGGQAPSVTGSAFRKLTPMAYIHELVDKIRNRPAIMCGVVNSRIAITGDDLIKGTESLLKAGLRVAFACPFPDVSAFGSSIDPHLFGYYSETFGHALSIAHTLRVMIPEHPTQIRVFRPSSANPMLVTPPLRLNEVRPCLTKFRGLYPGPDEFEMSFFVRFSDGRPDQWIVANPEMGLPDEQMRAEDSRNVWLGYLAEIMQSWELADKVSGDKICRERLKYWKLVET